MKILFVGVLICMTSIAEGQTIKNEGLGLEATFPDSPAWLPLEQLQPKPALEIWRKLKKEGGGNLMILIRSYPPDMPTQTFAEFKRSLIESYAKSGRLIRAHDDVLDGHQACKLVIRHRNTPDSGFMVLVAASIGGRSFTISHAGLAESVDSDMDFLRLVESVKISSP